MSITLHDIRKGALEKARSTGTLCPFGAVCPIAFLRLMMSVPSGAGRRGGIRIMERSLPGCLTFIPAAGQLFGRCRRACDPVGCCRRSVGERLEPVMAARIAEAWRRGRRRRTLVAGKCGACDGNGYDKNDTIRSAHALSFSDTRHAIQSLLLTSHCEPSAETRACK